MAGPIDKTLDTAKEAMKNQSEAFEKIEGPLGRVLESTKQLVLAQKELVRGGADFSARFEKSAQTAGEFNTALQQIAQSSLDFFGSVEPGVNAFKTLALTMDSFVATTTGMQKELSDLTARMEYLGFEASSLAKAMDDQAMAFGKTQEQVQGFAKVMARISRDLYVEPKKLLENYDIAQQNFAYNAEKTIDVFIRMQKESRKTGVEFSTMARAFGDEMDTFQGATQVAGRLNAVLAQSVFNPVELLGLDPAERMNLIRDRLMGQEFVQSALNDPDRKFELMSLAQNLNMGTMDFRKLMTEGAGGLKGDLAGIIDKRTGGPEGLDQSKAVDLLAEAARGTGGEMRGLEDTIKNLRSELENFSIGFNRALGEASLDELRQVVQDLGVNKTLMDQIKNSPDLLLRAMVMIQSGQMTGADANIDQLQFRYGQAPGRQPGGLGAANLAEGTDTMARDTVNDLTQLAKDALKDAGITDSGTVARLTPLLVGGAIKFVGNQMGGGPIPEALAGITLHKQMDNIKPYLQNVVSQLGPGATGGGGTSPMAPISAKEGRSRLMEADRFIREFVEGGGEESVSGLFSSATTADKTAGRPTVRSAKQLTLRTIQDVLDEDFKVKFRGYLEGWLDRALKARGLGE